MVAATATYWVVVTVANSEVAMRGGASRVVLAVAAKAVAAKAAAGRATDCEEEEEGSTTH